jgi:hypothetical protein
MELLKDAGTCGKEQCAFRALKAAGGRFYRIANQSYNPCVEPLGVDEHRRDQFDNAYSELGGLLRRLKYKGDRSNR